MSISSFLYLAKYYLQAKTGNKKPILGGIKLTHGCNLKCRQCPYWRRPSKDLEFFKVLEIMDKMYDQGVRLLIFEGGEPMLWRDEQHTINDVVREANKRFTTVGLTTNGTLGFNVNTDVIWVSIDGLKATHDKLRCNSFAKIITNLKQAKHKNILANITISKLNYQEVPELVKYISEYVNGITIQFFYPYAESENMLLEWSQRKWVLEQLIVLKQQGYPLADSKVVLEKLKDNNWKCEPWMLINANPDGTIEQGCYLKNRDNDEDPCKLCGFAAHAEASLAVQLNLPAIVAGKRILRIF